MKTRYLIVAATALLIGTTAFAGTQCTAAPQVGGIGQADMLQKLVDAGYTIERFQLTDGNCYKMHGWDKDGKRVEVYNDPADGSVVKLETKAAMKR
ncbi:MAG: PepSY domain-containing protein [Thauera phenolivorans]|uniref:PepSY domain-containing protein n=1 Tax=Thauera phenolivorans TaxID=1792543 RepID=A0A7X7LYY0_9RHOO|nr:PepSY domain-containing protein [Thauera phenolivorans]